MKKLRRKIVLGVLVSATVVLTLTVIIAGIALSIQVIRRADSLTSLIQNFKGDITEIMDYRNSNKPLPFNYYFGDETLYRLRFFTVKYDDNGAHCDLSHIASVGMEEAVSMADKVMTKRTETGTLNGYRYRISREDQLVIFLDNSDEMGTLEQQILLLIPVALFFVLTITLFFWFLSKRIVRPFEENSLMQKQFITDASHELKTPLAIISANAEVLAYKDGENEWINNITSQVERVSVLVNELLTLNRLEEVEEISDIEQVNISGMTSAAADSFEAVFAGKSARLKRNIEKDVLIYGNSAQLERLISVLIENASKYVSENGEVSISVLKSQRHTYLSVYNTCEVDKDIDYTHLFERFYRPDASRTSKTGGHGVGLSIAKRIVVLHNGSIEAVPNETGLSFNVKLPNKLRIRKKKH